MRRLTIADVGSDAAHAFRSMLDVLVGRMSCAWELVDSIHDADVVVTGDPGRLVPPPALNGKRIVAISESVDVRLRQYTPYVLTHPFRVMQVLAILDEVAEDLKRPELHIVRGPEIGCWDFAESVRALAGGIASLTWHRAHTTEGGEVLVTGNLQGFACEGGVYEQVRSGSTRLSRLSVATMQGIAARYVRRPFAELLWHNAWHASTTLAPWLDSGACFRIREWPDFGVIAPTRQQLQLVAAMAHRAFSRAQLTRLAEAETSEVDRLLNALSLCDLLGVEKNLAAPGRAAAPLPGFLRVALGSLRRSLKLAC